MVYGSETWPVIKEDLGKLERAEHTMIRCGVTLRDRVPSKELYSRPATNNCGLPLDDSHPDNNNK